MKPEILPPSKRYVQAPHKCYEYELLLLERRRIFARTLSSILWFLGTVAIIAIELYFVIRAL